MKKWILFIVLIFAMNIANAQHDSVESKKFLQKVTGGVFVGAFGTATFSGEEKPFVLGYDVLPNLTIVTPYTYHSVLYGVFDNSLRTLNGVFLKRGWDTYLLYSKTIHTGENYFGGGIEKALKASEGVEFLLFSEIGTNFEEKYSLTVGLIVSVQNTIWKRKK